MLSASSSLSPFRSVSARGDIYGGVHLACSHSGRTFQSRSHSGRTYLEDLFVMGKGHTCWSLLRDSLHWSNSHWGRRNAERHLQKINSLHLAALASALDLHHLH